MPNQTLDLSNVINVSILPTPQNLGVPNINTAALFTVEQPSWIGSQAFKIYTNPTDVLTDYGAGSKAFAIAVGFFAQLPNPLSSNGYLVAIPLVAGTETVQAAVTRTLNLVYYFGILVDAEIAVTPLTALATYVQTLDKMLFYASSTPADYVHTSGMLDVLRAASLTQTRLLYYKTATALDTQVFAAAYASRGLSTNFSGSRTVQTMHLKQLAGIVPDQTVDQTALTALQAAGADAYVSIAGIPGVFCSGLNGFFDEVYNEKWLKFAMQTAGFNYLASTNTKIPQTEQGMEGLKNVYRKVCEQGRSNGYIGPGTWSSPDLFGDPLALVRCIADLGYYVYSLPITSQLQADRTARKAPLIQIALKSAGAIHSSNVIVNVGL
jgi:hypothetical protein